MHHNQAFYIQITYAYFILGKDEEQWDLALLLVYNEGISLVRRKQPENWDSLAIEILVQELKLRICPSN